MSIKTEYKCDHCGHTQDTSDQMWSIAIALWHGCSSTFYSQPSTPRGIQHWCRKCVEVFGLLPPKVAKPEEVIGDPTLEDIIRELIRSEIAEIKP